MASHASNSKSALSPARQRISSTSQRGRPTPGTGSGVDGSAETRQRVVAAVGWPKSDASVCRLQRRSAMPIVPDPSAASWGHDKIGATAYANLDKKGTQQKIHISRKARIVPWIGFRTALWTIAGTPWPNFTLWRQSGVRCLAESCVVAYRPLLSADQWASLLAAPADERNLIRYASLSGEDLDLILSKRGHRNQLGFAAQICLMRFPGRALALN